jgi:hypothetical protein
MFTINASSGALAFTATSIDGVYTVIVKAVNDWGSDTQAITVTVEAAPAYVGPLDLVPGAKIAAGQRALSAAMLGQELYTIRRTSDNTTQAFSSDAVTGAAPAAAEIAFVPTTTFQQTGATVVDSYQVMLVDATGVYVGQDISGAGIAAGARVFSIDSAPVIDLSAPATATDAAVTLTFTRNGSYTEIKDQSGNGLHLLPEGGNPFQECRWDGSAQAGIPSFGNGEMQSAGAVSFPSGKATLFMVCKAGASFKPTNFGNNAMVLLTGGSVATAQAYDGTNAAGGDYPAIINDVDFYVLYTTLEFGDNKFAYNGTVAPENNDQDSGGALSSIADLQFRITLPSGAEAQEFLAYDGIMSAPNIAAIVANQQAAYSP